MTIDLLRAFTLVEQDSFCRHNGFTKTQTTDFIKAHITCGLVAPTILVDSQYNEKGTLDAVIVSTTDSSGMHGVSVLTHILEDTSDIRRVISFNPLKSIFLAAAKSLRKELQLVVMIYRNATEKMMMQSRKHILNRNSIDERGREEHVMLGPRLRVSVNSASAVMSISAQIDTNRSISELNSMKMVS